MYSKSYPLNCVTYDEIDKTFEKKDEVNLSRVPRDPDLQVFVRICENQSEGTENEKNIEFTNFLQFDDSENNQSPSPQRELSYHSKGIWCKHEIEAMSKRISEPNQAIKTLRQNCYGSIPQEIGRIHLAHYEKKGTYSELFRRKAVEIFYKHSKFFKNEQDLIDQVTQKLKEKVIGKEKYISRNGKITKQYKISNKDVIYLVFFDFSTPKIKAISLLMIWVMNFVYDNDDLYEELATRLTKRSRDPQLWTFIWKNRWVFREIFNDFRRKIKEAKFTFEISTQ